MNRSHQAIFLGGLLLAGCSLLKSFDGYSGKSSADAGENPGCELKVWPARPVNAPQGGGADLVGAVQRLAFYETNDTTAGFDLDGQCTCLGGRPTCEPIRSAPACDSPGGVDNQGGNVLRAVFPPADRFTSDLEHAIYGLAFVVNGYNGKGNDDTVAVSIFNVVGVNGKTDGSATAKFDGTDAFIADVDSTVTETELSPTFLDSKAYVTDDVLVAHFNKLSLNLTLPEPISARIVEVFQDASLVGKIEHDDKGLRIPEALVVGRIPLETMFAQAGPASTCSDATLFTRLKDVICPSLDISASSSADGTGEECDAISFAMKLDVTPAKLDPKPAKGPPSEPKCPPKQGLCK
jgi:hypothetical protein